MNTFKKSNWMKVTNQNRCPICKKSDWCCISDDGAANCMRVESPKQAANGGWIHRIGKDLIPDREYVKPEPQVQIDARAVWMPWQMATKPDQLREFGTRLGVEPVALQLLGCAWSPENNAWAFPMVDGKRMIRGIRLRNNEGDKWAVKGSRAGLFVPKREFVIGSRLYVLEGPTDTTAALTLGFSAIGRPSCLGCESHVSEFIDLHRVKEVVIVADNDEAGLRGAMKLQKTLKVRSCLWIPPAKDLREFLKLGGTREVVESAIKDMVWSQASEPVLEHEAWPY